MLLILFYSLSAGGAVYYVNGTTGNDTWSGLTKEAGDGDGPKRSLRAAILGAADGDEIRVADGLYNGGDNINLDFGEGLDADETRELVIRSEGGPDECIIDCDKAGRGFSFNRGEGRGAVLEGFTIRDGFGVKDSKNRLVGGGLYIGQSSPTIRNCVVEDCSAEYGGGVFCAGEGRALLEHCTIQDNLATIHGGGLYLNASTAAALVDCKIQLNRTIMGGGMYAELTGNAIRIERCRFLDNWTYLKGAGGGMLLTGDGSEAVIRQCVIAGNKADGEGGGICCYDTTDLRLEHLTVVGNRAQAAGGIRSVNCTITIEHSIIWSNRSLGEVMVSIAESPLAEPYLKMSYSNAEQSLLVDECLLPECQLEWGEGNLQADPCFAASGTWDANGTPEDLSDDFWGHGDYHLRSKAGMWQAELYFSADVTGNDWVDLGDYRQWLVWHNRDDGRADLTGDGLADVRDLLVLIGHFMSWDDRGGWVCDEVTSRCVDAGRCEASICDEWPDASNLRVNLGAYGGTRQASRTPRGWNMMGDANEDGKVNLHDFRIFRQALHSGDPRGDLNKDGEVDINDLLILGTWWLTETEWL